MEYNKFKEVLDAIRRNDEIERNLYDLGIDTANSPIWENEFKVYVNLFQEIYGNEGYEWINWYLFEQPHFQELIDKNEDKKEYHAWDENGEPMDLSTDDKLWEMLENEYSFGKKYHKI